MDEKFLAALLDLRLALGQLEVALQNIDKAVRKLMVIWEEYDSF